jgi:hypothetical protein
MQLKRGNYLLNGYSLAGFSNCSREHDAKGTRAYNLKFGVRAKKQSEGIEMLSAPSH